MPGIPLSNRCQYCKRRKIKCDEAWPTCGNCQRAKKECSGPPNELKFVLNNCHSETRKSKLAATIENAVFPPNETPAGILVDMKSKPGMEGSGTFLQMKILNTSTRTKAVPQSAEDKLCGKLATCVAASRGTGFDLSLPEQALGLMVQRAKDSVALRDSLECLFASFTNLRRGLPAEKLIDPKLYGTALKSAQRAFNNPKRQLAIETLAAATVMQRVEVTYDFLRGANKSAHAYGIYAVMCSRGPPGLKDQLEVYLAFENFGALLMYSLTAGEDCIYASQDWADALGEALDMGMVDSPPLKDKYRFISQLSHWPSLVKQLRMIEQNYDPTARMEMTVDLIGRASALSQQLQVIDDTRISELRARRDIRSENSGDSTCTKKFNFADIETAEFFAYHSMYSVVVNRILERGYEFFGAAYEARYEHENREWSSRLWRMYPYLRNFKPTAAMRFIAPIALSYESASLVERSLIIEALKDLEEYKPVVKGRWLDEVIISNCMTLTGRTPFSGTQDMEVELGG